ncbi:11592_t:CDS:2, partial [Gigaspora margarita]
YSEGASYSCTTLREHYFFWAIPSNWIQISNKEKDTNDNGFPKTIEQLNEQIQQHNLPTKWKFSVDRQEEFPEAADFLHRTFLVKTIPDFVFSILSFSPPGWDLFDENDNIDTIIMEQPNITNEEQKNETEISHELS